MRCLLVCLVVSLFALLAGAQVTERVVLNDGTVIDNVQAELRGTFVWVTFPAGNMQAYALEDVDREASGLLPDEESGDEEDQVRRRPSLRDSWPRAQAKCNASGTMSSGRSRKGGTLITQRLSRP